jgi:FlaA1/EpsC-like NDP-sugar epimerase
MLYIKNLLFKEGFYSKWLILFIDVLFVFISLFATLIVMPVSKSLTTLLWPLISYVVTMVCALLIMQIHVCIIRYANIKDLQKIVASLFIGNLFFGMLVSQFSGINLKLAASFIVINFLLSSSFLIGIRLFIKELFRLIRIAGLGVNKENVLIYGSDMSSLLIKHTVEGHKDGRMLVKGFIETEPSRLNKRLEQKKVFPVSDLVAVHENFSVTSLFISAEHLKTLACRTIIEKCIAIGIKVITVPASNHWMGAEPSLKQFENLKIDDLLEREPIKRNLTNITNELAGKRILVTGAAGSIGSEIVRQILGLAPNLVLLFDQAETPLHDMKLELEDSAILNNIKIIVGDVQNINSLRQLFNLYQPQVVFHAAAYKHVPMMEDNPSEAILTNVLGTKNLADCCVKYNVEKFIMISTDKAVRPTNIMGASKRIAEMYIQALNFAQHQSLQSSDQQSIKTKFITTRFGNVLGSNGSVIPRFKAQINKGGPVTVTHPDITRYFMTIPEAVQLVLEAAAMGEGGEIFLFDMGKPVRITDLAINMIKLAGFSPGDEIKIAYTGLRQGEKLHEELLNKEEETIPTYNKDIKISKTIFCAFNSLERDIASLLSLNSASDATQMVLLMKRMIPGFVSNNSIFENLDLQILTT